MARDSRQSEGHDPGSADSELTVTHGTSDEWREGRVAAAAPYMTLLGRFDLMRSLGMGASGAVFEAVDRTTRQTVALKLLHRCEPSDLYRIKSEFRALTEIAHPNLVAMHELFVDEQQRGFFTMELIHGRPFLQYVRPRPADVLHLPGSPQDRLRACLEQLAHAVQFLHAHGKLHRDLKPSNVLVNPLSGRLTIVDFGLVQSLRDADAAGSTNSFEGTPAYAAPEQIDPYRAVFAMDWYAVGVMLYEALAGKRPFEGADSVLQEKLRRDPAPPSTIASELLCPELEPICMRLLERDPTRRADGRDLLAALGSSEQPRLVEPVPAFVGRETELEHLERAFGLALAGAAGGLSIVGQSGIGKTCLAHAFLDQLQASRRALVLRGRCYVQEALHYNALDGVMDALTNHLRQLQAPELERLIPRDVAALVQLFPILRRVPALESASRTSRTPEQGDVRAEAFAALRALLVALTADAPLVLFIDDLQWADADSARLLQELLSPPIRGMWIIATERSDAGLEGSVFDRLGYVSNVQRLSLGPLSEHAVAELARRMIDDCASERAQQIARRSSGHPLFASELIRHARADSDGLDAFALEAAIAARLHALSPEAYALLELVCMAGQRLPQSMLLEGSTSPQLAALRELRVASAIRDSMVDDEQHVEPYHDRIREYVIAQLPEPRRQALHSALAERMRARGSAYLERVIQRYVLAGREREAALLAEEAAQQAAHGFAFHGAAQLLELALRHAQGDTERQRLRLVTADACEQAGRTSAAAQHLEQAAESLGKSEERTELRLRAALNYCIAGHTQPGSVLLTRIVDELGIKFELQNTTYLGGLYQLLVTLILNAPKLQSPSDSRAPATSVLGTVGAEEHLPLRMLWRIAPILLLLEPHQGVLFMSRAFDLAAAQGQRSVYGQALALTTAFAAFLFGRPSRLLERNFARAEQLVQDDDDAWHRASVPVLRGLAAVFTGQDERALELCHDAAMATQLGSPFAVFLRTCARMSSLLANTWLGRMDKLQELSDAWRKEAIDNGDRNMEVSARLAGLQALLARDDVARASAEVELAHKIELDNAHPWLKFEPCWLASLPLYRGEPEHALAVCVSMRPTYDYYARYTDSMRLSWWLTEGSIATALAMRGVDRAGHLRRLRRYAWTARLAIGRRAPPVAAQLSACVALLEGKNEKAAARLRRAIAGYDALGSRLYSASLRLALARLEPEHADAHERAALKVFAEEGVVKPLRFAYMIAPGLIAEPG